MPDTAETLIPMTWAGREDFLQAASSGCELVVSLAGKRVKIEDQSGRSARPACSSVRCNDTGVTIIAAATTFPQALLVPPDFHRSAA
jgi:hypothetical protein